MSVDSTVKMRSQRKSVWLSLFFAAAGLLLATGFYFFAQSDHTAVNHSNVISDDPVQGAPIQPVLLEQVPNETETEAGRGGEFNIPEASRKELAASLRGTQIDGGFDVDANGNYVPSLATLRLFNYFFSATGEEGLDVIRGRIILAAMDQLAESEIDKVVAILDDFIQLRDAIEVSATSSEWNPNDLQYRLDIIRDLRHEILGADVANAFYSKQEQIERLDLQRIKLLNDTQITEDERQYRLQGINAQMPPDVLETRKRTARPAQLSQAVSNIRQQGKSEEEVFQLRAEYYGDAAAKRLAELDKKRAEWNTRMEEYTQARQRLTELQDQGNIDQASYTESLEALRAEYFTEAELLRVIALEKLRF